MLIVDEVTSVSEESNIGNFLSHFEKSSETLNVKQKSGDFLPSKTPSSKSWAR